MQQKPSYQKPYNGLYIHIPFCIDTCDFCAFYQEKGSSLKYDQYIEAIKDEISLRFQKNTPIDTIFWGGGTPILLPLKHISLLSEIIHDFFDLSNMVEWTVEIAPSASSLPKLKLLKKIGVTRISIGMQSLDPKVLDDIGRTHSVKHCHRAFNYAREVGFDNINIDLMFALPSQTDEIWINDLNSILELKPEHISTYCLTLEEDTPLYLKLLKNNTKRSESEEASLFLKTWSHLKSKGFHQYEIANFALNDSFVCKHNLHTWHMHNWIGIGPAASGQWNDIRYTNKHSLKEWKSDLKLKKTPTIENISLTEADKAVDSLIFGLRLSNGINLNDWFIVYGKHCSKEELTSLLKSLEKEGLVNLNEEFLIPTDKGKLLCDAIAHEISLIF